MIPVCDVPSIEYYGIFVVSESRLYEFNKNYSIGTNIPVSPYISDLTGINTPSNGVVPLIDRAFAILNQINSYNSILSVFIQNEFRHNTHGMCLYIKGKFISQIETEFAYAINNKKIPFFSSKEKALEFLIDVPRVLFPSTNYIEFRQDGLVTRLPEELAIVKFSLDKLTELSATETVIINPYVPGFF